MQAIDRIWRILPINTVLARIKAVTSVSESADYTAWRQRFFRDRLILATWAGLFWTVVQMGLSVATLRFHLGQPNVAEVLLVCHALTGILVAVNLLLQRTQIRRCSKLLFLGLCWSLTGFVQVGQLIISQNAPEPHLELDVPVFTLIFLTLAALVPVRWRLHAIAQLGVLAVYFVLQAVSGLQPEKPGLEQVWIVLFQLWVCFICDLGVYLYEHLKRAEITSRHQLQVFVQTVSEDLRTPVLASLQGLKDLLKQPGEQIVVLRSKLEEMLESSDRQFDLVNSLLQKARSSNRLNLSQRNRVSVNGFFTGFINLGLKRIEKTGRALGLKELAPSTVIKTNTSTIDYEVWRYQFVIERLRLVWWISFGCTATLFIPEFLAGQVDPFRVYGQYTYAMILLYLAAWSILYRSKFGRDRPALLFISFACGIPLISQFFTTILGMVYPEVIIWTIMFLMMATLIPVCWRLHVISQVSVLVGYLCMTTAFGIEFYLTPMGWIGLGWYLFWICGICDITVYTYERLQQNEFDSRRQLRIFLHSVAHDLKTPVLGASLVLQNLLNRPGETLQVPRYVIERMVQGGDRQLHLINSLLEAHVSPTQGVVCQCEPTQLRDFTQAVIADVEPLLNRNQAVLANLVPADLPPVNADPLQLWRVFENLVTNALKYNPPGVKLTLKAIVESGMVRCSIQDNGVGISPDLCKQIFDLYSRGSHVRRSPGLGLGLYLCQQIITAHGGKIGVISSPGAGSTFWFTLPLAQPQPHKTPIHKLVR
jgi:signal transduction histidine kinase